MFCGRLLVTRFAFFVYLGDERFDIRWSTSFDQTQVTIGLLSDQALGFG